MDPIIALGAAGSVVGIADVAFKLAKSMSTAYNEIASTEMVLKNIVDEVDSVGRALNQVSNLIHDEEQNIKNKLSFKLFSLTALSDIRMIAERCLVIFWRIEGTILEKAGSSDFEKQIETRRAQFRRHASAGRKDIGAIQEFSLSEGLADAVSSFFRRAKWQLKGILPTLKGYCEQLRGLQLVFEIMLPIINLQTSQRIQDWNGIGVALTQTNTVDQQRPIPDVVADLPVAVPDERVSYSQRGADEPRISSVSRDVSPEPQLNTSGNSGTNHDSSSGVGLSRVRNRPEETASPAGQSIHEMSPPPGFLRRTRTPPESGLDVRSEQNVSSANVSSKYAETHNACGEEDRSRLVFIVKGGLAEPAPQLSREGLDRGLAGKFNLRPPRDLGYREFAFLDDSDRKAIHSLLENVKPSKHASVHIKKLKKCSLPTFCMSRYAVLVVIEEPVKSPEGDESITDGVSNSDSVAGNNNESMAGTTGESVARNSSRSPRASKMSEGDYLRKLTTYRVISIQPLMDVCLSKISVGKLGWDDCSRAEVTLDRADVLRRLKRIDRDGLSVANKMRSLNSQQRDQIRTAFRDVARKNQDLSNFEWTIRQLELIKKMDRLWSLIPTTRAIVVYLQRSPRPHTDLESLYARRVGPQRSASESNSNRERQTAREMFENMVRDRDRAEQERRRRQHEEMMRQDDERRRIHEAAVRQRLEEDQRMAEERWRLEEEQNRINEAAARLVRDRDEREAQEKVRRQEEQNRINEAASRQLREREESEAEEIRRQREVQDQIDEALAKHGFEDAKGNAAEEMRRLEEEKNRINEAAARQSHERQEKENEDRRRSEEHRREIELRDREERELRRMEDRRRRQALQDEIASAYELPRLNPSLTSLQAYGATDMPQRASTGLYKDIVNMLLLRWTPGVAEVTIGPENSASHNEQATAAATIDEENVLWD